MRDTCLIRIGIDVGSGHYRDAAEY
jgi:hypothetical protein